MALDDALKAYQAGHWLRAAELVDPVLDQDPDHPDALMLAGLIAHRRGRTSASIALFDRAVRADPEHHAAWTNRAHPLAAAGRMVEAEESLRRALRLGTSVQAGAMLLRVLIADDRPADAMDAGERLREDLADSDLIALLTGQAALLAGYPDRALPPLSLALRSGRAESALLVVRALRDRGDLEQALALLARVRGLAPDPAEAHNLEGTLLQATGRSDEALHAFEQALAVDASCGPAHHNLAGLLFSRGHFDAALPHHLDALDADPNDHARWVGFVDTVSKLHALPDEVVSRVKRALSRPFLNHQGLERAVRHTITGRDAVADALAGGPLDTALIDTLDTALVHAWWRQTRVLGPAWEPLFTRLRRAHLLDGLLEDHPELATSLAAQAWHTEFAWASQADESEALAALDATRRPLAWTAYQPWPPRTDPSPLPPLLRRLHLDEPAYERALSAEIPSLGETTGETSAAVRRQYEEHPYPRLLSVHRKPPLPLPELLRATLPGLDIAVPDRRPLRVLIAGCGTGQQILGASRYAHARILAIDLSLASLGVAARQVEHWGMQDRVELAQADLLANETLPGGPFDVIECGGVLHHLADPLEGWRVLRDQLAPDGVMKIALYSERARRPIVAAQALTQDLPTTDDGLREARQRLLRLPEDHPAKQAVWSPDFPSLSGFRDLVRHACEHRFTPLTLRSALDTLDLELLGFQHPDPRATRWYAERFPDDPLQRDLERWDHIEEAHPECFVGMFQFWCRRRPAG